MNNSPIVRRCLAILACLLFILPASAVVVSYGFSGYVAYVNNPSNTLPANIIYGAPFNGMFTYDTEATLAGDQSASTNAGNFYFSSTNGISMYVSVAGHLFFSRQSGSNVNTSFIVHDDYVERDSLSVNFAQPNVLQDGNPFPGNPDSASLLLYFLDNTATALSSDVLPTNPPVLAAFTTVRRVEVISNKDGKTLGAFQGTITNITTTPNPVLFIKPQPGGELRLTWPLAALDYQLETNSSPSGVGWAVDATPVVDSDSEHTVTVPNTGSAQFFRLKK